MYLAVKVTPNASSEKLERGTGNEWRARVRGAPVDGKANARLIALVAASFGCPKSSVTIMKGHTSRHKLLRIDDTFTA